MALTDPLRDLFTSEVCDSLRKRQATSEEVSIRLRIIEADEAESGTTDDEDRRRSLLAYRRAWVAYISASSASGMLNGDRGADLRGRLRGADSNQFRSAMAECMSCWLLSNQMHLLLNPDEPGRGGKKLDMRVCINEAWVGVEVKAPFREHPKPPKGKSTVTWCGDDSDKIAECLKAANKQFRDDGPNLLVIVPTLRLMLFSRRHDVVCAAYGENRICIPVDPLRGQVGPTEVKFSPNGKFLNPTGPNERPLKLDGLPAYRRISAILCIEEKVTQKYSLTDLPLFSPDGEEIKRWRSLYSGADNDPQIDHNVMVFHNPFAYHPLSEDTFERYPQLVRSGDEMTWTDGYGTKA
ncbi:MAG: hypothetical protein HYX75_25675 [Acidobacteria bacterium]|nr:hypothetical protein [Acidobacteriota bacterium]